MKEVVQAAGFNHPSQLEPHHIYQRHGSTEIQSYSESYHFLESGELLEGTKNEEFGKFWEIARADSFDPRN